MNKNIIVLVPSLGIGGQERQAVLLAEQLCKDGKCKIVVFFKASPCFTTEVDVLDLNCPPHQSIFGKIYQQFRRAVRLIRLRKREGIDLVISFGDTANLTNILSRGQGKCVVSLRTSWAAEYSTIKEFVYKRSDRILCQTEAMREILLNNFCDVERKSSVFYNIFDVEGIMKKACEPCRLEHEKDLKIITVGRLDKLKGYRHLIRAFSDVSRIYNKVKLFIVGEGDEHSFLKELANHLGMEEKIIFTGVTTNPYKYMKNADIFVSSSCVEGFPNVLVEAMLCGLPVIATDCETGPREILSSTYQKANTATGIEYLDYGVLVPAFQNDDMIEVKKEKMLAKAILELVENQDRRKHYSEMGKKRAYGFSVFNTTAKIERLFFNSGI